MKTFLLAALFSGAIVSTAWSAPEAPAARAPTGVEDLVGAWTVSAEDPGTREAVLIDYRVEPTAGGTWLTGQGKARDGSLNSRDMWGRDPLTREIIRVVFDGSGAFATIRSPGWQGDRLVLEGDVRSGGGTVRVRESLERQGPGRFRAVWEANRSGAWVPYSIETLTRQG
jgi:hypothetical protein